MSEKTTVPERRSPGIEHAENYELRVHLPAKLEIRAAGEDDEGPDTLVGTFPYDTLSEPLGFFETFREKIAPGCFTTTVDEDDIRCLFNHNDSYVLGRSNPARDTNTLSFRDSKKELTFEVALPGAGMLRDLVVDPIERGDIDGCSFGFSTIRDEWDYDADEADDVDVVRTLLEVRLFDVSPVTFPAYPESDAGVRAIVPDEVRSVAAGMKRARGAVRRETRRRLERARDLGIR